MRKDKPSAVNNVCEVGMVTTIIKGSESAISGRYLKKVSYPVSSRGVLSNRAL